MKATPTRLWQIAVVAMAVLSARPAIAQPEAAAWTGVSQRDPTDYERVENWIDLISGQVPSMPPSVGTEIFLDSRAGQAPRDPEGNVVVRPGAISQAGSMTVEALPFRLSGVGFLDIVDPLGSPNTLVVQREGALTLDDVQVLVRDSIFVGGGPNGPTSPASMSVLPGSRLDTFQTLKVWDGSTFDLRGGTVTAAIIDTDFDPQRFQWSGGMLSFDEYTGDLFNLAGDLVVGRDFNDVSAINGSYFQQSRGNLLIDLAESLEVEGTLHADGTLHVSRMAMDPPLSAGNEFDLLDFASLEGQFAEVVLPNLPPELSWDTNDLHTQGVVRVFDAVIPVAWTGAAGDGDYFNPQNWEQGNVPLNTQDQAFAITLAEGADVMIPANQAVETTRLTQTADSAIRLVPGSQVWVTGETSLSGITSVAGSGATFTAIGSPTELIGAPQLEAREGGTIELAAERYDITADPAVPTLLSADGPRSRIELAAVDAIAVETPTDQDLLVAASNGGEIDLSGLTTMSGVIEGAGQLVLRAASGGTLVLGGSEISARTTIEADGPNSVVEVDGGMVLGGSAGIHVMDAGTVTLTAPLISRGKISGTGTIEGTVFHSGVIAPGDSTGVLSICGDLVATDNGVFMFEIEGPADTAVPDKLTSCRRITLGGHLTISLIDGGMGIFEPIEGAEFELFQADDGIGGRFDRVSLPPLTAELGWTLLYEENTVSLMINPRLPGDFDADGDVDRDDLPLWQTGAGLLADASQTDGDADGDGDVDGDDLLDYVLNFGMSNAAAVAASPASVPEPGAAWLAGLLAATCLVRATFRSSSSRGTMQRRSTGSSKESSLCSRTSIFSGPSLPMR